MVFWAISSRLQTASKASDARRRPGPRRGTSGRLTGGTPDRGPSAPPPSLPSARGPPQGWCGESLPGAGDATTGHRRGPQPSGGHPCTRTRGATAPARAAAAGRLAGLRGAPAGCPRRPVWSAPSCGRPCGPRCRAGPQAPNPQRARIGMGLLAMRPLPIRATSLGAGAPAGRVFCPEARHRARPHTARSRSRRPARATGTKRRIRSLSQP